MNERTHTKVHNCFLLVRVSCNSASFRLLLRIEKKKMFVLTDPTYLYKTDLNNSKHVGIYDIVAYGS